MNYQLKVQSTVNNITLVEAFIDKIFTENELESTVYGNVLIAVSEAAINGIVHGNKSIEHKHIYVNVTINKQNISFSITDEGEGFNFEKLPNPTLPENIEKLDGRGIFLMQNLADNVSFDNNGKTVVLDFNLNQTESVG